MKNFEELRAKKPRLYRVACELSTYEEPYEVLNALVAILGAGVKGERKA